MSRTNTTWPRSYSDADRMLHYRQDPTAREVTSRKIANNTWLVRDGEAIAVVLHSTAVVVWTPDGRVQLATGGWDTPITRDRIHGCTPVGVYVRRHKRVTCLEITGAPGRAGWFGEFRDGTSFHIDDPGQTLRFDTPREVAPPSRPRSTYPVDYYGFTVSRNSGREWPTSPAPRELTQAERLDALRREVAALHREADLARDPEFPYSAADAEYGETYQAVDLVRAGGEMPPTAPVWVPRGKR